MRSILKILQQYFIHYNELNELREAENENFLKSYRNFVQEFVNERNAKERNIINSLTIMKKSFDNLMIIENDETKNQYRVDNNEKYIGFEKYEENNEDENEYKKNQENKKNKSNNDDDDDENMIMTKITELSD